MNIDWIPYPRKGTSVCPGRWLCTLHNDNKKRSPVEVLFCTLEFGEWAYDDGSMLEIGASVVAIAYVPRAYVRPCSVAGECAELVRLKRKGLDRKELSPNLTQRLVAKGLVK